MPVAQTMDLAQKALASLALGLFAFFAPPSPSPAAVNLSGRFRLNEAESAS